MRHISVKISVQHAFGKGRRFLGAPDDAVKFLPGIAEVKPVEIDDKQRSFPVYHHVSDVIIAVLKGLRAVFDQVAVGVYVSDKVFAALGLDGAGKIAFDFPVHFAVKARFPVFLRAWRGDGMDFLKDFSAVRAQTVLFFPGEGGNLLLRVLSLDPRLNGIYAVLVFPEFKRIADRKIQIGELFHHLKFRFFDIIGFLARYAVEKFFAAGCHSHIFFIARPALVNQCLFHKFHIFPSFRG